MEHEKLPEELDDLISDIHRLIDVEKQAAEEAPPAEAAPEQAEEQPAEEPQPQPESPAEATFHQQRWTDRQRVPKHVAKLQHNQEEAYARWLAEQEGKDPEPPPEFPEEMPRRKFHDSEDLPDGDERKKRTYPALITCLILIAVTLAIVLVTVFAVPQQPKADGDGLRVRGSATVVLAGTDTILAHTDAIMLLSMDARHKKLSIVSIPRDTLVETRDGTVILGSVYGRAGGGSDGIEALRDAVADCIGYMPDGCLVLHPQSLTLFASALGGIDFDLPETVVLDSHELQAGPVRLTGEEAYEVLRRRSPEEDLDLERIELQQAFLTAVIGRCAKAESLLRAPKLLDALTSTSLTDMNIRNLLWLARTAMGMDPGSIYTQTLPGRSRSGIYALQEELVLQTVNGYCNPYLRAITAEDLAITKP